MNRTSLLLTLAVMQAARLRWSNWMGAVPHTRPAVWIIGLTAGAATMLANAAGMPPARWAERTTPSNDRKGESAGTGSVGHTSLAARKRPAPTRSASAS